VRLFQQALQVRTPENRWNRIDRVDIGKFLAVDAQDAGRRVVDILPGKRLHPPPMHLACGDVVIQHSLEGGVDIGFVQYRREPIFRGLGNRPSSTSR